MSTTYSLDTNVMIDIANDRLEVLEQFDHAVAGGALIVTSAVAAHEFIYGCMISPRPKHHLQQADILLRDLHVVDWDLEDAVAAADVRKGLRWEGRSIGAYDNLIAGQAMRRGWTLVSSNLHEFYRVRGLAVVDWRAQPD